MNIIISNFYACKRCENVIFTQRWRFCKIRICETATKTVPYCAVTCNLCAVQKLNWNSILRSLATCLLFEVVNFNFQFYRMKTIISDSTFEIYFPLFFASFLVSPVPVCVSMCVYRLSLHSVNILAIFT